MSWFHRLLLRYWRWRVKHGGTWLAQRELERLERAAFLMRLIEGQSRRIAELQRQVDERESGANC